MNIACSVVICIYKTIKVKKSYFNNINSEKLEVLNMHIVVIYNESYSLASSSTDILILLVQF